MGKTNHVPDIPFGESLNLRQVIPYIPEETRDDCSPPSFPFLSFQNHPPDIPVHKNHFRIGGESGINLCLPDPGLDVAKKAGVVGQISGQFWTPDIETRNCFCGHAVSEDYPCRWHDPQ